MRVQLIAKCAALIHCQVLCQLLLVTNYNRDKPVGHNLGHVYGHVYGQ